jgi:hypothetical protein
MAIARWRIASRSRSWSSPEAPSGDRHEPAYDSTTAWLSSPAPDPVSGWLQPRRKLPDRRGPSRPRRLHGPVNRDERRIMKRTNPFGPRRSRSAGRNAIVFALLATVSLSACGGGDEDGNQAAGDPDASAPSPSPSPGSGDENANASDGHADPDHLRRHRAHRATRRQRHRARSRRSVAADAHLPRPQQRREDRPASQRAVPSSARPKGTIRPPRRSATTPRPVTWSSTTTVPLHSSPASSGSASSMATWPRLSASARTSASPLNGLGERQLPLARKRPCAACKNTAVAGI